MTKTTPAAGPSAFLVRAPFVPCSIGVTPPPASSGGGTDSAIIFDSPIIGLYVQGS